MSYSPESQELYGSKVLLSELMVLMNSIQKDIGPNMLKVLKNTDLLSQNKKIAELAESHQTLLNKTGLKLELRKMKSSDGGGTENIGDDILVDINVDIVDKDKFVQFLSGLKEDELTSEEKEALAELGYNLEFQLTDYYNIDKGEDEFLTLATALKGIADNFSRLSIKGERLNEYAETFSNYYQAMSGKFFKEWLRLRVIGDNVPIDFFNPKYEHMERMLRRDTPDIFQNSWEEILYWIKKNAENKNTHVFLNNFLTKIQSQLTKIKGELKLNHVKCREPDKVDDYIVAIDEIYSQIEDIVIQVS